MCEENTVPRAFALLYFQVCSSSSPSESIGHPINNNSFEMSITFLHLVRQSAWLKSHFIMSSVTGPPSRPSANAATGSPHPPSSFQCRLSFHCCCCCYCFPRASVISVSCSKLNFASGGGSSGGVTPIRCCCCLLPGSCFEHPTPSTLEADSTASVIDLTCPLTTFTELSAAPLDCGSPSADVSCTTSPVQANFTMAFLTDATPAHEFGSVKDPLPSKTTMLPLSITPDTAS